jgi:CRISPR-associated protein Cas1
MRKLLNTLYVTNPDAYLSLEGETVVIRSEEKDLLKLPLLNLEGIVTFGFMGASPALMRACTQNNISLCFLSPHGRFLGRVIGESNGNVLLRKAQYRLSDNEDECVKVAGNMITGKLYNAKSIVDRAIRDHGMRLDVDKLKNVSEYLYNSINELKEADTLDRIRGIEGKAASTYFDIFDDLILQQKDDFVWKSRIKRPPTDNLNALLSFFYVILANECAAACETVGLDSYVGIFHRDRPGRTSLALDILEELRAIVVDRFVLSLVNKMIITKQDFITLENGAVVINDNARKKVLTAWQERKRETIMHPYLEEQIEWGLVPHCQAMLLARYIRGDIEEYPPFLWK